MFPTFFVLLFLVNYSSCNVGFYVLTGDCPPLQPAINFDLSRLPTLWTITARSLNIIETLNDCSMMGINTNARNDFQMILIIRPKGSNAIRGFHATFQSTGIANFVVQHTTQGQLYLYLGGHVTILETDHSTYALLVICESNFGISNLKIYVLVNGNHPADLKDRVATRLSVNGINPSGIVWDLDLNCAL